MHKPLSDEVMRYGQEDLDVSKRPKDSPVRLANLALAIFSLRGEVEAGLSSSIKVNPLMITSSLEKARNLDLDLLLWRRALPDSWETMSMPTQSDTNVMHDHPTCAEPPHWLGSTATYPSYHTAGLLNQYRINRIAVQTIVIECASRLMDIFSSERLSQETAQMTATKEDAHHICGIMVDEICASVPFLLGNDSVRLIDGPTSSVNLDTWDTPSTPGLQSTIAESLDYVRKPNSTPINNSAAQYVRLNAIPGSLIMQNAFTKSWESQAKQDPQPSLTRNIGCYMLLQPLIVANSVPNLPTAQKLWMHNQAMEICRRTGMEAGMVERGMARGATRWSWNKAQSERDTGLRTPSPSPTDGVFGG